MQLLERHPLGAEIAGAEDVLPVAADGGHAALAQLDRQAAAGFAQGADAVGDSGFWHAHLTQS